MNKWKDFKHAIANPPPERLAYIEFQSHFLNILGVLIVSIILILSGYWYIILAFIFSVGVSYSQGMAALNKYNLFRQALGNEPTSLQGIIQDIEMEKSQMRKRRKTIVLIAGRRYSWLIMLLAVSLSLLILNPINARWYIQLLFTLMILPMYIILYFIVAYSFIRRVYERKYLKGGTTNERS